MAKFKLKVLEPKEDQIQQSLVAWLRLKKIPHLHVPNEAKRSVATTKWLEAMGVWWGASDLFITVVKGGYGGFWIELKAPGKEPNEKQVHFLRQMNVFGYRTDWFDDWVKAKEAIETYMGW